ERSKEGPTKADAFADANVNIVHRGQAFRNHAECLLQNRGLQAVHKKTLDLTLHDDRRLPDRHHEIAGTRYDPGIGPRRRHNLHGRYEIRRVDGMGDNAPRTPGYVAGKTRWHDGRARTGEHDVCWSGLIELGEQFALNLDIFWCALLNVDRTCKRL